MNVDDFASDFTTFHSVTTHSSQSDYSVTRSEHAPNVSPYIRSSSGTSYDEPEFHYIMFMFPLSKLSTNTPSY